MSISDEIQIEKASIKDVDEIYALEQLCFKEDAFSKKQFNYLVRKANGEFVVVRKNNKIIAYLIILKRKNSKQYRIYSIAVNPHERGLGIAKKLLDYAEEKSIINKTHKIALEVSENNITAVDLYKKQGYKKIGTRKNYYADGSSALIMTKEL